MQDFPPCGKNYLSNDSAKEAANMRYQNPILPGFHPDPSICRAGADYYLVTSTFEYFPGVPVYHSRDLVNWTQIGNALQRPADFPLDHVADSGGVWAPTIRYHEGKFYITATLEKYGNFIVTADDPAEAWSAPIWLPEIGGIDPSLFFEDGDVWYCTNDRLDPAQEAITAQKIDVSTGKIIGERYTLWSGIGAHFIEAPHIYHSGDWYYLLTAEGGTFWTHMVTVARSRSITGPYESCPHNPILTNACDTRWEVLCTGHGDLIDDPNGNWWMVHLAVRLARRTMGHLGRETFLTPCHFEDGWPVCDHADRRALLHDDGPLSAPQQPWPAFTADMSRTDWEPQWLFLRQADMTKHQRVPGEIRLTGTPHTLADPKPTFAALRHMGFDTVTEVSFTFDAHAPGDEAGLALRLSSMFNVTCTVDVTGLLTLTQHMEDVHHVIAQVQLPAGKVHLRLESDKEKYSFYYMLDGAYRLLGTASTRFLAVEIAGKCFVGTVIGLYAASREDTGATMHVTRFTMHTKEDQ